MKAESAFEDLNIDAMTATKLMGQFGLSLFDLQNPARFSRFQQVVDFIKNYPEDIQNHFISKVLVGKGAVDKLDKFFEYSQLLQKRSKTESKLNDIRVQGSQMGATADPLLRVAHAQRELAAQEQLRAVDGEIGVYER
jgi:hypothetical protein